MCPEAFWLKLEKQIPETGILGLEKGFDWALKRALAKDFEEAIHFGPAAPTKGHEP